ncbi:ATP synthase subunit I [Leptolyngbya sp. 7M]|uniref:ATP synthase subunit I n=1 Tax=Leptolyngbya sp. 7M TaxID=2812896 RepID=UPI0021F13CAE|nr:ATP synthase subunit I [Leptolyngbya sp. 7M]
MNSSELPLEPTTPETELQSDISPENQPGGLPPEPNPSMQEYYKLQMYLLKVTLILTGIIFLSVWIFYSLNIALNYLIGACTGVVYLKMLARNVEQLGRQRKQVGKTQLALFVAVIVLASQLQQLEILPIFLGFLTYKAALIVFMFRTLSTPYS